MFVYVDYVVCYEEKKQINRMEKYVKIKDTVEAFYSNGNKITTKEYLDFFNSFKLNQSEWELLKLIYSTSDNSSTATELHQKR